MSSVRALGEEDQSERQRLYRLDESVLEVWGPIC